MKIKSSEGKSFVMTFWILESNVYEFVCILPTYLCSLLLFLWLVFTVFFKKERHPRALVPPFPLC